MHASTSCDPNFNPAIIRAIVRSPPRQKWATGPHLSPTSSTKPAQHSSSSHSPAQNPSTQTPFSHPNPSSFRPSAMAPTRSRRLPPSSVAATATPTTWSLLDPEGVTAAVGTTQYSRDTAWFEMRGEATLVLHTKFGEVVDPYGGAPVRFFPEVASTDADKVLVLLRSSDPAIPSGYIVLGISLGLGDVVRLPDAGPGILLPRSIGLLTSRDGKGFKVFHLSVKPDKNTGLITQGSLHWCWFDSPSSSSSSHKIGPWAHEAVTLPLLNCRDWYSQRVVSFLGTDLLFIDLRQGILRLRPSVSAAFDYFDLPQRFRLRHLGTKKRPEMFRSFGCCNGALKFVNLSSNRSSPNILEVDIWNVDLQNTNNPWSKDDRASGQLNCRNLWENLCRTRTHTTRLPSWPKSIPIFPILSKDGSNILYLTVAQMDNKHAWLLKIDMQTKTLMDVADYPGYCSHRNPPFPINLSRRL